jgi:DNA-binding NtrC family response regulator
VEIKVLLVDDEEDFVETLGERLANRGFKVRTAVSGNEALDKLSEEPSDVVLLDVLMPGMDGLQTLRKIKTLNPLIEVMMLTGHGALDTAIQGMKLGAYDYLKKPTDTADLVEKISRAFARKSEQEQRIRRAETDRMRTATDQ